MPPVAGWQPALPIASKKLAVLNDNPRDAGIQRLDTRTSLSGSQTRRRRAPLNIKQHQIYTRIYMRSISGVPPLAVVLSAAHFEVVSNTGNP